EALNDFFDSASEATDTSAVDNTLEFEEFSLFEMPAATDNFEVRAGETQSPSELEALSGDETPVDIEALDLSPDEPDTLDFEEDLLAGKASSSDWNFEAHEEPTREEPAAFLDFDGEDVLLESLQASDLELLLGDETPMDIDALDLSSDAPDTLDFEENLLPSRTSSSDWEFETQEEFTGEEPAAFLDFDGEDISLESPQASDLESLLGDETPVETDALEVSQENLFESESASDWELESVGEESADSWLNWEDAISLEGMASPIAHEATENLEDFLGAQTDAVTDAQDWDELLSVTQGSDTPNIDNAAPSEDWLFEAQGDETPQALELDWETTDSAQAAVEDDFSFLTTEEDDQSVAAQWDGFDEFEDLGSVLSEAPTLDQSEIDSVESDRISRQPLAHDNSVSHALDSLEEQNFADLEELVLETPAALDHHDASLELPELDDLDAMLGEESFAAASPSADFEAFDDLDALLGEQTPDADQSLPPVESAAIEVDTIEDDEFGDLEILLEQAEKTMGPQTTSADQRQTRPLSRQRPKIFEQTMRVPVKHLDSLSNLVGELVVNRNSLEQDQEQLRQFLDNLSHQVLALSDVGSRMQDLYERTLLESSLLASRYNNRSSSLLNSDSFEENNSSGVEYDPLEMDRFTGFHLLSQEMIELIVRVRESASDIELLVDGTDQVARMLRQVTTQLQEGLTRSRMVPFAQTADRLPRAVREISIKLRKQAELHVEGRETLIDKMILEHLYDPLTHLVNNAITHGIEAPEVRKAAGKSPIGKITLRAFHQGNQTVISISDDGAGIDPEQVRRKAVEKRLITAADARSLTNLDLYDYLFRPGFSTKDKADDFSGRGVGMDVVRTSLSEIRGVVHIDSGIGKGTTFTIRLPLTLSICKALCCLSDRARMAFPMDGVEDMLDLPSDRIETNAEGQTCIQWRDMLLPFQSLSELLTYKRQLSRNTVYGGKREDDIISIVVLRSAGNFLAIQVDQVLGEQEIVIKQLEGPPPKPVGIAGATVLGDGRIMPIADVLELIDLAQGRIRKDTVTIWSREELHEQVPEELPATKPEPLVLIVDDSITVRELLSMTFTKAGYRVEQARDGQDAWDKLRSGLPCDIVFCDIEMPRMDGLELLSRLQKDETLNRLPIAMLTSRGADRHRQMASQLGASGYFTKPYLEEVLLDAAQRMIKGDVLF
ncbi:MAG TPA: response regulator, partial [Oculatellaceae cyanobacterium]